MEATIPRVSSQPDVRVIFLGGSVAKGTERPESDVDLIVVVDDEGYRKRLLDNQVSFLFHDVADYEGGYVEGRFLAEAFIFAAADRGSEPTRHSFAGARPVWGHDPRVIAAVARIPVYPEHDRERRLDAFYAQMVLNRSYFWTEAIRREDVYLKLRSASEVVLFGGRMVLAHHRVLFQNQKRLMEMLERHSPAVAEAGKRFLEKLNDESLTQFCDSVLAIVGSRDIDVNSRFLQDSEMSWFNEIYSIAEW